MINLSTSHQVRMGEVLNVMYFEHDGSLFIDNAEDDSVQIHGVETNHLIRLLRNVLCCRDAVDIDSLTEHDKSSLFEIYTVINNARNKGHLGACAKSN